MKRIIRAYRELLRIIYQKRPAVVIFAILSAAIAGVLSPALIWANQRLLDLAQNAAMGITSLIEIVPTLILFVLCILMPNVIAMVQDVYVDPACELIFRTTHKGKMLQKLKRIKYENFESEASVKIIDQAFDRAETAALHLFPKYLCNGLTAVIGCCGSLILFANVRWWLPVTLLAPYVIEQYRTYKNAFNIYEQMEGYWNSEQQYEKLEEMLKNRQTMMENRLLQGADYLIRVFQRRMNARNREYEKFYFLNLRKHFAGQNLSRVGQFLNALFLLLLYSQGQLSITQLIALTTGIFTTLSANLSHFSYIIPGLSYHIRSYEYYDQFFELSEDSYGKKALSEAVDFSIEFSDVCFSYPGTDKLILNHMSFRVENCEKLALVGANGEGKTTLIKLLLGLFQPDGGEILIGGKSLSSYSQDAREALFGPVFQDFTRYSISLRENVAIGDLKHMDDKQAAWVAMKKGGVDSFLSDLPQGEDTILNRDFDDGVDLSGGQWQRIAIARALMGSKPILILDEPTSQLDPMAESALYKEFAEISHGKTSIFITHRLGSTQISDRILVISGGRVAQSGTHEELVRQDGLYAQMWNSQKQWYNIASEVSQNE